MKSYKDIRHLIKHGDTFATASPALFSRLIRFAIRSKVSHTGNFVWIGERLFIIESLEGNDTRMMLASQRFSKERLSLYRGGNFDMQLALSDLGVTEYGIWDAIIAKFFDTKSARTFCSKSTARWLQLDFSHLNRGILPSDICTKLNRVV